MKRGKKILPSDVAASDRLLLPSALGRDVPCAFSLSQLHNAYHLCWIYGQIFLFS